ncbi:hypothetical protein [Edaphocola aurantiacus]|uniref:hypothetical protein n=1 Tax=Edaphocola aurantiacus TaxID=2601682 RepID=UPI001C94F221|nr:hypothetical protein [Edaphocola aurantiacus]
MPPVKRKTTTKKAAPKRKTVKKAATPKKSKCASELGRKGGLACKAAKKGIHSPAYKKKVAAKAKSKKKK